MAITDNLKLSKPHMIYRSIIVLIALYASFKRNNGFDATSFLAAFLFQEIYIIYILAVAPETLGL